MDSEQDALAKKKTALDAQAAAQSAIFNKQLHNSNTLKAEVTVVGKAEKSALANAVKLGEVKAHAEDQAHIILAAQAQKRKEKADARTSKWTMKHTAALGKLMVVTREVDNQLAHKKRRLKQVVDQLKRLHTRLTGVVDGNQKVQSDNHAIRESTEEMSREELGESNQNKDDESEDLGESNDTSEDGDDDLGVALAHMGAKFAAIQRTMNSAASQEADFEKTAASKRITNEKMLKDKVGKQMQTKRQEKAKQTSTKKQRMLEKNLEKEEARLRMTTAAKVHAQFKLENAVDDERATKSKEDKKHRGAISRLTPQMETRLEYQRMYVQNAMQQAQQQHEDLNNQLADVKGNDAQKLKQLTLDVRMKRKVLRDSLDRVRTLAQDYQRDHDMGEGLDAEDGARTLANDEAKQQEKDIKEESHITDTTRAIMRKLRDMEETAQAPLVQSAKALLGIESAGKEALLGESSAISATDTDGVEGAIMGEDQIKLAAKISMAKTGLKLKLDKLAALRQQQVQLHDEARHIDHSATAARDAEYDAQTRSAAMKNIIKDLTRGIHQHEESMMLGETLFSTKRKDRDTDEDDLGESSSSDTKTDVPPIQAELNYEHKKLAEAEAELRHLTTQGPKIIKEQIAVDKLRYGKALKKTDANLNALHKRFVHAAAMLSPKIKSQVVLEDAVRDEQNRQSDYAHDLDNVSAYAGMVDVKAKAAAEAARRMYQVQHDNKNKKAPESDVAHSGALDDGEEAPPPEDGGRR